MVRVSASSVIAAPIADVWKVVRDFGGIGAWLPGILSCEIEGEGAADRVGSVRRLQMVEVGTMREQLLGLSDPDYEVTFAIIESAMPIQNYRSTITLNPITDGDETYIRWSGEFETSPEHASEMKARMPRDIYQASFDMLKKRFR